MARTSVSHPLKIAETPCGDGVIGMTFCPGKKGPSVHGEAWDRDLAADLQRVVEWRPDVVVSLMESHEFDLLRVPGLGRAVRDRGIEWLHLPIVDVSTPDEAFERRWVYFGHLLRDRVGAGGRVLLHCRGGLGRTGLIAARLLVEFGAESEWAISSIRRARPGAIETDEQAAYVRNLGRPKYDHAFADRVLGCLFGGAVGDAFGYAIEFMRLDEIRRRFGSEGLTEPVWCDGHLTVSDDTQMTLFTAEGLARALRQDSHADSAAIIAAIRGAYLDWLKTQRDRYPGVAAPGLRGLLSFGPLWARRAPGNTCMSALTAGGNGTPEQPINASKGCGGVMRVAPIGLLAKLDAVSAFDLGARAAALTHGHPSGFLSAAAAAGMIRDLAGGKSLSESVVLTRERLIPRHDHREVLEGVEQAVALAAQGRIEHSMAIGQLGEGWVGEEALAIALYAALAAGSFRQALAIAANHDGDSDSTASIAGQLWGATHGLKDMPAAWIAGLDVFDAACEVGNQLLLIEN